MHSPFVKQLLNSWSSCNRIIPKDWRDLVKTVLEPASQLQWSTWFREEAKTIEQYCRAGGIEISSDELLGDGDCATIESQSSYGHSLALCHAAALSAWIRIQKVGKKIESFTKVIQGQNEPFTDFY